MALKLHRSRLGINQTEAAALLGRTLDGLSQWERGVRIPDELTQEGAIARLRKASQGQIRKIRQAVAAGKDP